jgi:hypothetical protein
MKLTCKMTFVPKSSIFGCKNVFSEIETILILFWVRNHDTETTSSNNNRQSHE